MQAALGIAEMQEVVMASSAEYLEFILDLLRDVPSVTHRKMIRNSRPYFLPHGSGISTGQTAPMAL